MTEFSEKQLKTRWVDIKKQLKERPLLAYRVKIPLNEWDKYMLSTPEGDEVNRIYDEIKKDRQIKTLRIKEGLSKIVGYRESKEFSRKIGVSDTSIRGIIEGKLEMAGYEIINKIELFLHVTIPEFKLSFENPLSVKNYAQEFIGEIASDINQIADYIKQDCFKLTETARKLEKEINWRGDYVEPTYYLESNIKRLSEMKDKIDLFWKTYVDKKA